MLEEWRKEKIFVPLPFYTFCQCTFAEFNKVGEKEDITAFFTLAPSAAAAPWILNILSWMRKHIYSIKRPLKRRRQAEGLFLSFLSSVDEGAEHIFHAWKTIRQKKNERMDKMMNTYSLSRVKKLLLHTQTPDDAILAFARLHRPNKKYRLLSNSDIRVNVAGPFNHEIDHRMHVRMCVKRETFRCKPRYRKDKRLSWAFFLEKWIFCNSSRDWRRRRRRYRASLCVSVCMWKVEIKISIHSISSQRKRRVIIYSIRRPEKGFEEKGKVKEMTEEKNNPLWKRPRKTAEERRRRTAFVRPFIDDNNLLH